MWGLLAIALLPSRALPLATPPPTAPPVLPPEPIFEHLTVEQGLPEGRVAALLQDHQGYLWFGTLMGLARYDGYSFKVFRHQAADPHSLSDNEITVLYEDQSERLWVGTRFGGLELFDRTRDQFTHFLHDPNDPESLPNNTVKAIFQDRSGSLWIGTSGGLAKLDSTGNKFIIYGSSSPDTGSLSGNDVRALLEDSQGVFWVGTQRALDVFDPASGRVLRSYGSESLNPRAGASSAMIERLFEDSRGTLWIGTRGGLLAFDRTSNTFKIYSHDPSIPSSIGHDTIRDIRGDSTGTLWIATDNGLSTLNRNTGQFRHYSPKEQDPTAIRSRLIQAILEDRAGTLWFATFGDGVEKLDRGTRRFSVFSLNGAEGPRQDADVTAVFEDRTNDLWIGTYGDGLFRISSPSRSVEHYRYDPRDPHSLTSDFITSIAQDNAGALWVGTYRGGLNRMDPGSDRFRHYLSDKRNPGSLSDNDVWTILVTRNGTVWIGTFQGLNRFDPIGDQFVQFRHSNTNPFSLSHNDVRAIVEDTIGSLWVGTKSGGLNLFDVNSGNSVRYQHDPNNPQSLNASGINTLYLDASGGLWIGSDSGLSQLDPSHSIFRRYDSLSEGTGPDRIEGIVEDAGGTLWVSSDRGLYQLDPRSGAAQSYDTRDGLRGLQFNRQSILRSRNGSILLGSTNGINVFRPERLSRNRFVPPVVFTSFQFYPKSAPTTPASIPISGTERLDLNFDQNSFSVTFAALNYRSSNKNRYAYRLEGLDTKWTLTDSDHRTATYSSLPPGRYRLVAKGSNNDEVWNEEGASLEIRIYPPWWQTLWARSLAIVLSLGMIAIGVRWRTRAVINRNRELKLIISEKERIEEDLRRHRSHLEEIVQERTRELEAAQESLVQRERLAVLGQLTATVSHELRNPLGVIRGSTFFMQRKLGNADEKIAKHLNRIEEQVGLCDSIVNELLEYTRGKQAELVEGDLNVWLISVMDLFVEERELLVARELDPELPHLGFDQEKMRRVVLNLLENAFHAVQARRDDPAAPPLPPDQPAVIVRTYTSGGRGVLEIEDHGIGMDSRTLQMAFEPLFTTKARGTGLGLANVRKIVVEHGGEVTLESVLHQGTIVKVTLPLRPAVVLSNSFEKEERNEHSYSRG